MKEFCFNFIKNHKNIIGIIFNVLVLIFLSIYLFCQFRYSIVAGDDILDYICEDLRFYHGRFIPLFLTNLFIETIPKFFNIPIQNFAFFSEGIVKLVIFLFFINICSISFFKNNKISFFSGILYCIIFIFINNVINYLNASILLRQNAFFIGYFLPIPIFLLLWYKLAYYYTNETEITKKDFFIISFLVFLMPQLNEFVGIVSFLLLLFLIKKLNFLLIPLFIISEILTIVLLYPNTISVISDKLRNLPDFNIFSIQNINDFLYGIYKCIITDNIFYWLFLILLVGLLILNCNSNKTKNLLKFYLFSYISIIIFFVSLYFMGLSNNYIESNIFPDVKNFWITYFSLLFQLKTFLFVSILYLFGFLISIKEQINTVYKNHLSYGFFILFLIICINIPKFSFDLDHNYNDIKLKQYIYLLDKISVFYLKQGKTAILPKSQVYRVLPENVMPSNLNNIDDSEQIFYFSNDVYEHQNFYLKYIEKIYNVDISPGMTFRNDEDAIKIFLKNGGSIKESEIKLLDFRKITE